VLATRLVKACKQRRPHIGLRVLEGWSGFIEDWLCSGQIDLGLVYNDAVTAALVLKPLVLEELFLIKRAAGTSAVKPAILIADLHEIPIVVPGCQHGLRRVIERALADQGRAPRVAVEAEALSVIKGLVEVEGWDAVLPKGEARTEIAAGKLAVPFAPPGLRRQVCVAWADRGALAPATQAVLDLLIAETEHVVRAGEWAATLGTSEPSPTACTATGRRDRH